MAKKTGGAKKVPAAPLSSGKKESVKKNPLFEKQSRNFRIGGDIMPKRDLTRFTKWPRYVRLQRQKRILLQRIKVPSALAQFEHTADKNQFAQLVRVLKKYRPETRAAKNERLRKMAEAKEAGTAVDSKAPHVLKFGLNHVVDLIENKKAKLVVIAHDVDPVELVCFLPVLCRKKDIPYMIIKGKSRLGQLVNKKTATCVAVTEVGKEDHAEFNIICENAKANWNENREMQRRQGGGLQGVKSMHVTKRRAMLLEKEQAKKTGLIVA